MDPNIIVACSKLMSGIDLVDQIKQAMPFIHKDQMLNFKSLMLVIDLRTCQAAAARDKIKERIQ